MNQILKLREERANTWEMAKAFLESHRDKDGMVSAEDSAVYDRMEEKVVALGKEIERLERQRNIDDRKDLISDTIIPWVADWLLYYELWLATGEWLGGGHGSPSVNNSH